MATAAVKRHWARVAALGCIVCGAPAELAHCHGGSIVERMQEPKARGKKLDRYGYLVLPLCALHHRLSEAFVSLDASPPAWEQRYGTQASHIDRLCELFGVNLWELANKGRK